MLLITFAPMVSQLLASNARAGDFSAELCSAHASAIELNSGHHAPDALAHLDDQACGYCHFFAHAPAISSVRASATLDVPARRTVAVAPVRAERPAPAFTTAQPRAPPVLI
ncbi:MFS transporter [Caballeronia novacaledonica]|uniref:MFS transporter n=2 Tax=Caballeronia novacaledonica TaxID=1544861 RepID=A0A2U3IDL6_9BURK|nr:MFS transporter [Caballeronia novacaledonica]